MYYCFDERLRARSRDCFSERACTDDSTKFDYVFMYVFMYVYVCLCLCIIVFADCDALKMLKGISPFFRVTKKTSSDNSRLYFFIDRLENSIRTISFARKLAIARDSDFS